jgi:hypothetical protein
MKELPHLYIFNILKSDFHHTVVVQPPFGVGMLRGGLAYSKLPPPCCCCYATAAADAAAVAVVGVIACSKETSQHPLLHTDPS